MLRAHKIPIRALEADRAYFTRAADVERYAFNWCLTTADAYFRFNGVTLSDFELMRLWNHCRKYALPWTYVVSKHAGESGVKNYCAARANWFNTLKKKAGAKARRPRLKSKRRSKKTFAFHDNVEVNGCSLTVPKYGVVRLATGLRFPGKIKNVTISEQGGQWFASFLVELSEDYVYPHRCETQAVVGIDLGLNAHLALASGEIEDKVPNPKFYRQFERKLKRAHRALSRKQEKSRNRVKAKQHLAETYKQLTRHRSNHLHQATAKIVRLYRWIGVEDLAVANMMKNHSLARALADASFGEIRRQLLYKAEWAGSFIAVADRWFASSKICSVCDYRHDALRQGDREWTCPSCGSKHDRDINAARNLEKVARGLRDTQNACVTAQPEQRSRRQSRWSKGPRAAAKIQE